MNDGKGKENESKEQIKEGMKIGKGEKKVKKM